MRFISITNKTYSMLKRLAENPVSGWNIMGINGKYMIQISNEISERLVTFKSYGIPIFQDM